MILFDGHIHIYHRFDVDLFWHSGFSGLGAVGERVGGPGPHHFFLLLTESAGQNFFAASREGSWGMDRLHNIRIDSCEEKESLQISHTQYPDMVIHLVAGRQLKCGENLELLALFTLEQFADGQPFTTSVEAVLAAGGLPVCPWGVGKWLGKRGKLLSAYCADDREKRLLLGDNGGRPALWPRSALCDANAARLVSGSDPLELPGEEKRVGSYGGYCSGTIDERRPAASLKALLENKDTKIHSFGAQLPLSFFLKKQISLRMG